MGDDAEHEGVTAPTQGHGPGRPPGQKKTGGRKPGVPNKITVAGRELIQKRGRPIELLCDIARGRKVRVGPQAGPGEPTYVYPSFADRMAAAKELTRYVLPQPQAVQITGANDGPVAYEDVSNQELERVLADVLGVQLPQQPAASTIDLRGLGPELASAAPPTAARGLNAEPLAATDYSALTKELGEGGVEILDPHKDHSQGIVGRDPAIGNGRIYDLYPGAAPGPAAMGRRDERPPKGMSAPASARELEAGERVTVKGCDGSLEYTGVTNGDGRHRFWILDRHGQRLCAILGQAEAEAKLRELHEKGRITR